MPSRIVCARILRRGSRSMPAAPGAGSSTPRIPRTQAKRKTRTSMLISANGVALEVDDTGRGEPLLLLMGLGMQLVSWPEELVSDLCERGYRVIRMDNRDSGLSQGFDEHGRPSLVTATIRY